MISIDKNTILIIGGFIVIILLSFYFYDLYKTKKSIKYKAKKVNTEALKKRIISKDDDSIKKDMRSEQYLKKGNIINIDELKRIRELEISIINNNDKEKIASYDENSYFKKIKEKYSNIEPKKPDENKSNILIVDDSLTSIIPVINALNENNNGTELYNIFTANDGRDAWRKINKWYKDEHNKIKIDLIISDYDMPCWSGKDLADKVKSDWRFQKIPILIMSANINNQVKMFTYRKIEGFLTKPTDSKKISALVNFIIFQ